MFFYVASEIFRFLITDGMVHKICPQGATNTTKNEYATVESKDNKQYENSNRRYYNISWKPINGKLKLLSNDRRLVAYINSRTNKCKF